MVDGHPNVELDSAFGHDFVSNVHDAGTDNHDHIIHDGDDLECLGTHLRAPKKTGVNLRQPQLWLWLKCIN